MKKILILTLILLLSFSLTGCSMLNDLLNGLTVEQNTTSTKKDETTNKTNKSEIDNITKEKDTTSINDLNKLSTPTVSIDEDGLLTIESVSNATSYTIVVTSQGSEKEYILTNDLTFELKENESAVVKANGDNVNYSDSSWSERVSYVISKLSAPILTENYGDYTWSAIDGAISYTVNIDGVEEEYLEVSTVRLNIDSKIKVKANASNSAYSSDYSEELQLKVHLITVTVSIDNEGYATFTGDGYSTHYQFYLDSDSEDLKIIEGNTLRVENGRTIRARALYRYKDNSYTIISDWSEPVKSVWEIEDSGKLQAPNVVLEYGSISWERIENAQSYEYKYGESGEVRTTLSTSITAYEYQEPLYIRSRGFMGFYEDSDWAGPYYYQYLHAPQVRIYNNIASWNEIEGAEYYEYTIDSTNTFITTSREVEIGVSSSIQVKACSKYYIDSKNSTVDYNYGNVSILTRTEIDKMSSTGYKTILGNMANGANIVAVYNELENSMYDFYKDGVDVINDEAIVKIDYRTHFVTDDEAKLIYEAFVNDHPFYFWLSHQYSYGSFLSLFVDSSFNELSKRREYETIVINQIDSYKEIIEKESSEYDIIKKIHDIMINDMYYAYDSEGVPSSTIESHSILGLMYDGYGVCESYAQCFTLLCSLFEIDEIEVTGIGNGGAHAWNMVKLDEKYYLIDVTWDDEDKFGYRPRYDFFIRTNNEIVNENNESFANTHTATVKFEYPVVSTTTYQE